MTEKRFQIGDLCRMEKGISPTLKTPPGPYPLVVTADFRRSADTWQIDGPAVCVPLVSSTGHGDAALHRVHYQDGKFALANLLVALIPTDARFCDAKYLYHLLMARKDELLVPLMQGTANVSLKEKDIAKVEISLPTLDQQRRIVARIDTVATQIEEARTLQREVADELDALVISNHMRLSERRERRLSEILQLDEDAVQIDRKAEYPQVGIRSFGAGLFPKPPVAGNETTYRTFNRLFAGAVVLSQVKGWEGAIAICPESLAGWFASPEYRTFRCIDGEAVPSYLNRLVRTQWFWSKLAEATRGVGARRERTRPEQFLNVKMLMPTGQAQEIGAEVMAKIGEAERLRAKCAIELNALLPSVISRVFAEEL